jgi:quercetin dioxygenase-like cupin family protein
MRFLRAIGIIIRVRGQSRPQGGAMNLRKSFAAVAVIAVVSVGSLTLGVRALYGQVPGFKRVELQKHDISVAGHETVMARGELNPGGATPRHTHPGEEVAYILEGQVTIELEGKPPVALKAGDVFFVPAGTVHMAKNSGTGPAKIVSTYIVEKGKPLATPAPASGAPTAAAPTAAPAKK